MLGSIAGLMLIGIAFIFSASTASDPNSNFWIKPELRNSEARDDARF